MAASLSGEFNLQEFTDAGALMAGGRLYTYSAGTTTLKTAYTDAAASVPHTYTSDGIGGQYIALNSRGELPAPLFLTTGGYDIALKTAAGVTVWTRRASGIDDAAPSADSIPFSTSNSYQAGSIGRWLKDLALSTGASLIGWIQAGTGAVLRTIQAKLRDQINVADYGAVADGGFVAGGSPSGTDNLAAFNAALAAAVSLGISRVHASGGIYYLSGKLALPRGVLLEGDGTAHMPIFLSGSNRRGTVLLINGAAADDCLAYETNAGHSGLRDIAIFNTNSNAIRAVVSIVGQLHPKLENVEIASLRATSGVGLLLDSATSGAQYGTIYGHFENVIVSITNIGTANEASVATGLKVYGRAIPPGPANANIFLGGSIAGKNLALDMDGTGAGTGARNVVFDGVKFEGTYHTGLTHTYHANGRKVVGFSTNVDCYTVQFLKLTRALGAHFDSCYFELGGVPSTYNDGSHGVLNLAAVVWLDSTAEVQFTGFTNCTWSAYVYDNGLRTKIDPDAGGFRYDTRVATVLFARSSGVQSIPHAAFTKVQFGTLVDGNNPHIIWDSANNQAIVGTQGRYCIDWQVTYAGWATAATYATSRVNAAGNNHQGSYAPQGGAAVPITTQGSITLSLVVGDAIYIESLQNEGGSQNTSGANETRLCISKVA